jgi:hypothetical protein
MTRIAATFGLLFSVIFVSCAATSNSKDRSESAKASSSSGAVKRIAVCTGIQSKEPIDDLTNVDSSFNMVYVWMNIEMDAVPANVKHVYFFGVKNVGEIPLQIKSKPYRTWSNHSVWPGKWRVEVQTESGEVLAGKDFTVSKAAP